MKIRRYMGNNMQEALLKVKMDLGNDAVILNTRRVKRQGFLSFLKPSLFEILASLEEEDDEAKKMVLEDPKVNELENKVKSMESMLEKIFSQISNNDVKNGSNIKKESKIYDILIANMRQNDIEEEVIKNIVESLKEKGLDDISNVNEVFSMFQKEIIRMLGQVSAINLDGKKPKVIMFLGPTGVGKTTTLAKIAANFMIRENKKVGLITADTYRIAAVEQLKTYSEIMGAAVTIIYSPNEIKGAIEKHEGDDLILIDTPGKSHKNRKHFDEIKDLVHHSNPDEIYLLLSASTNIKDCKEIIKAYDFIDKYKLIFTKIDETESLGIVMNIANMTGKNLSYFTIGQSVPDDIEMINVDKLSKRLLGKG